MSALLIILAILEAPAIIIASLISCYASKATRYGAKHLKYLAIGFAILALALSIEVTLAIIASTSQDLVSDFKKGRHFGKSALKLKGFSWIWIPYSTLFPLAYSLIAIS